MPSCTIQTYPSITHSFPYHTFLMALQYQFQDNFRMVKFQGLQCLKNLPSSLSKIIVGGRATTQFHSKLLLLLKEYPTPSPFQLVVIFSKNFLESDIFHAWSPNKDNFSFLKSILLVQSCLTIKKEGEKMVSYIPIRNSAYA